jgi:hypothetical protein
MIDKLICLYRLKGPPQTPFLCRLYRVGTAFRDHFSVILHVRLTITKLVWTTPQKLFVQCHQNLTGVISMKSSCAYHQHFLIK